ncbi:sialate O-acetylesterase [Clostridium sp. 19966]|uniref:sialate O-acetylesterase n=1 Tax=Clostridium sp. 19966 TaxID=2768166 RepID=UPI0028DDF545|nr:sialate O-acetylesterase [Clostridium sp. 19966]MDT8717260.1 sialate O-acetylesterase [Clostridium sp. 19966]
MKEVKFQLAKIFCDKMVLQRDADIPVWGTSKSNETVKISINGSEYQGEAKDSKWFVYISPLPAGGPYDMKVTCGNEEITIKDILIGDVWVAGGQSNMEFNLKDTIDGREEAEKADYQDIRYYQVPKLDYEEEGAEETASEWVYCNPETAKHFSAVAYHFARVIHRDIKVPIGIINCNRGGTSASCWLKEEYLAEDEDLKIYLDEYYNHIKDLDSEVYEKQIVDYDETLKTYNANAEKFNKEHPGAPYAELEKAVGQFPWPPPFGWKSYRRPSGLYNIMVKKITPYAIKGVIWYQGEEDASKPRIYGKLFNNVIKNWREDFNRLDLPFLFVQLPRFNDETGDGDNWAYVREAQMLTMKNDLNTAMAVSIEYGERDDVHPKNKKPVGERVALLAKAKVYGENIEYTGPIYKEMKIQENKIIVSFEHIGSGLEVKGETLKSFKICGEDRKFVEAKAAINGDTVEVYGHSIDKPVAVRYGFTSYDENMNLYNREGLPASPFRTDNF